MTNLSTKFLNVNGKEDIKYDNEGNKEVVLATPDKSNDVKGYRILDKPQCGFIKLDGNLADSMTRELNLDKGIIGEPVESVDFRYLDSNSIDQYKAIFNYRTNIENVANLSTADLKSIFNVEENLDLLKSIYNGVFKTYGRDFIRIVNCKDLYAVEKINSRLLKLKIYRQTSMDNKNVLLTLGKNTRVRLQNDPIITFSMKDYYAIKSNKKWLFVRVIGNKLLGEFKVKIKTIEDDNIVVYKRKIMIDFTDTEGVRNPIVSSINKDINEIVKDRTVLKIKVDSYIIDVREDNSRHRMRINKLNKDLEKELNDKYSIKQISESKVKKTIHLNKTEAKH